MSQLARDCLKNLSKYIPGKQEEDVKEEFALSSVIKLASNENPLGPSPRALRTAKKALKESSKYPDQHHVPLRSALAAKFGLSPDNFVVGNGSDEIMLLIAQAFLNAGQEVVLSRNTFSVYEFVAKLMDGRPLQVDLKDHAYDIDGFIEKINPKTKLVFICNPNNPTGTIVAPGKIEDLLSKVSKDTVVVVDEAYGDYCEREEFTSAVGSIEKYDNLIVLKTFSKIYGLAALRVGYGVSSKQLIECLNLVKMPFNVNRIGQIAALAALDDAEFVKKSIKNNSLGKKYLYKELSKLGLSFLKTQANFIYIDLKRSAEEVFVKLMQRGIIIRPLNSFGLPTAIRVTIGKPFQNKEFIKSLKEIL